MPNQPCPASFRQKSSVTAAGSAMRWRTKAVGHSFSRNRRALVRSSSCSSVKPISILSGAPVTTAVEPQHVAEMRPQTLRPRRVRGFAPFGRARHLGRGKMVERDVTLGGAGTAVATGAQGTGHRAERRDMLLVVPLVEVGLVLRGNVHPYDQQRSRFGRCGAIAREQLLALKAHQALAKTRRALGPGRTIFAADSHIRRA